MRDIDIERIRKLGLNPADFAPQEKTDKERITELEAQNQALLDYIGLTVRQIAPGTLEVVKKEFSADDPIVWLEGMTPIDNAFYLKEDGHIYVYMSGEWVLYK